MLQQFRRRQTWVVMVALVAAGAFGASRLADDRSSGSGDAAADASPPGCRDVDDLTAEERQNCELTGSIEPHPVLNVRLREPIVRGMTFAKAQDVLREAGSEVSWIRAHEHALPLPKWVVCYQAETILPEDDHVRFVTRIVLAPECPPPSPRISDGERLARAERRLDEVGIEHVLVDAADEDFPQAPSGAVGAGWVVCGPTNVLHEVAGWLTGHGNGGYEYESGDKLIVSLPTAPDRSGCSRSNEEEEQGESVRAPDLVGANYYKALEVAESIGVELDYPREANLSSDWIVCEQDPPAGSRLSPASDTLRVRFAARC